MFHKASGQLRSRFRSYSKQATARSLVGRLLKHRNKLVSWSHYADPTRQAGILGGRTWGFRQARSM